FGVLPPSIIILGACVRTRAAVIPKTGHNKGGRGQGASSRRRRPLLLLSFEKKKERAPPRDGGGEKGPYPPPPSGGGGGGLRTGPWPSAGPQPRSALLADTDYYINRYVSIGVTHDHEQCSRLRRESPE